MKEIPVKRVDAFTDTPFAGNPAAVITNASVLAEEWLQPIACEMAASETAFVLPPTRPGADLRIRWLTPTTEVPLCGHATVAAFHALAEEGQFGLDAVGSRSLRMECLSGILIVTVERPAHGPVSVTLSLPIPRLKRISTAAGSLAEIVGLALNDLDLSHPAEKSDSYAVVPIRTRAALDSMRPSSQALERLGLDLGVHGFVFFTRDTVESDSDVHVRFFAPAAGVYEDPVTGSAHGPLAAYLFHHNLVGGESPIEYRAEQGDGMGRPGRVRVAIYHDSGSVSRITITGRAVTVLTGTLFVP